MMLHVEKTQFGEDREKITGGEGGKGSEKGKGNK